MTKPLIVFHCEGKAAYNLADKICDEARVAGLSAQLFRDLGQQKQRDPRDTEQDRRLRYRSAQQEQQEQQQQGIETLADAWQVVVTGSVPIAAFVVFAKNCLDLFEKIKGVTKPIRSIEVTLDGRKIEIRAGDEIHDLMRRYNQIT